MDRLMMHGSRLFASLAATLLAAAALAAPGQSALADDDPCAGQCSAYTVGSPQWNDCMNSCHYAMYGGGCPNPISNGCPINNGNQVACLGILCSTSNQTVCDCQYANATCYCP